MKNYETMIIINPKLEDENVQKIVDRITSVIKEDGKVLELDKWGIRELAYEIKDHSNGYYIVINFSANPAVLDELERVYRISDQVLRYLILKDE